MAIESRPQGKARFEDGGVTAYQLPTNSERWEMEGTSSQMGVLKLDESDGGRQVPSVEKETA